MLQGQVPELQKNMRVVSIFSIVLVSIIIISSQSPLAFGGQQCGESDPDCDNWYTTDNCPNVYNPGQEDSNGDGIGDACDSVTIAVQDIQNIIKEIKDLIEYGEFTIDKGQTKAVLSKLQNAADKIEADKINGAIGSLNAFINKINSYINTGDISYADGQALIVQVQSIIDSLQI